MIIKHSIQVLKVGEFNVSDYLHFVSPGVKHIQDTLVPPVSLKPDSVLGQVIAGSLLSDAHMDRYGTEGKSRIVFTLGYSSVSISMLASVLGMFKAVDMATGHIRVSRVFDWPNWEIYPQTRYVLSGTTGRHVMFNEVRDLWYPTGTKIVPANIEQYLSPLALAFWLIGDGSRAGYQIKLATHSFSDECQVKLQLALRVLYGIDSKLRLDIGGAKFMVIDAHSSRIFAALVQPYLHTVCTYKLPNNPRV